MSYAIIRAVSWAFSAFYLLLLIRVIISWVQLRRMPSWLRPIQRIAFAATEPLLRPIRNALRKYQSGSPIDFSPLVLYALLVMLERVILRALRSV